MHGRNVIPQVFGEAGGQGFAGAVGAAHGAVFHLADGEKIAGGGRDEDFVGGFEIGGHDGLFDNLDAGHADLAQDDFAGDAGETARTERRGPYFAAVGDEDVGRGAFGDFAAFVEQDDFVEAALLRFFE